MSWEPWSRKNPNNLVRYVTPLANRWLPLDRSGFDLERQPDGRRRLVEAIYNALLEKQIQYALEEYHPSALLQIIRTPAEVLVSPRRGTCLDLAALFCGLCLSYDLLPMLIVTEGHALAAVSLTHGLRQRHYRPGRGWFENDRLTNQAPLREQIEENSLLAVECTGFAYSEALGQVSGDPFPESVGRERGVLPFDRAVAAGREQLDCSRRPYCFALDVAVAHYDWRLEPYSVIYDILQEAPDALKQYLRVEQFHTLVKERTQHFIGRDFIFKGIDEALADPNFPSGYLIIRGEPGIGKTALAGQLVKTRGYVHHFNIASQNICSIRDFLGNICSQLISRYGLPHTSLSDSALLDSGFLSRLLGEVVRQSPGQRIVVLIDALDEAEDAPRAGTVPRRPNCLYLPPVLPHGVYFIVTTREKDTYQLVVDRSKFIYLRDDDPQNTEDVRTYVRNFLDAHRLTMEPRLAEWGLDDPAFVGVITDKSEGNFMYLVYVLQDIRDGRLTRATLDDFTKLPRNLHEYYDSHWVVMQAADSAQFERRYRPVVCLLAVARQPVTVAKLLEWNQRVARQAGHSELSTADIKDVLRNWRQFFNVDTGKDGEPLWRIYHASFLDFLREKVDLRDYVNVIIDTALSKIQ
jgi:hypothetical protein